MIDRHPIKARAKEILLKEQHIPNVFLVSLIYVVIIIILNVIRVYLSDFPTSDELYVIIYDSIENSTVPNLGRFFSVRSSIFSTISTILNALISLGFTLYTLKISRGQSGSFWTLFEGFEYFIKFLIMCILIGISVGLASILFIVPGIILTLMFSQAEFIMLDNPGLGAVGCMKESARIIKGHKREYFVLCLSLLGWYLFAGLCETFIPYVGALANIWVFPYTGLIYAQYYDALKSQHNMEPGTIE